MLMRELTYIHTYVQVYVTFNIKRITEIKCLYVMQKELDEF